MADQPLKGFESLTSGTHTTPSGSILSFSHTPPLSHQVGAPVLVLLHGWPQDRYIWRYAVPPLAARGYTLFVPDLPGYGHSTLPTGASTGTGGGQGNEPSLHDRSTVGAGLLAAVRAVYADDEELRVVLVAHDRGARVSQRVATTSSKSAAVQPQTLHAALRVRLLGIMLMDIVPYTAQWASFANPRAATRYFHWAFLPTALSTPMIKAYGGGAFCRAILNGTVGSSAAGRASLFADGAADHYARMYGQEHVVAGGSADYSAGAAEDWDAEQADLEIGRKIGVPTCVLFSERNVGGMHGVQGVREIWARWVHQGVRLECHGIGGNVGHYLPEEAPEEIKRHIFEFLESLGV
ncbi:Alpha/Beta hydrolase protein [Xylariaceae sp. FL0804]|nr:Alpha/Beta hydrolase protein [Xylariaceae sp. FL0804]